MPWPALIFGWPTVILALCAFAVAFIRAPSNFGFAGLILAAPFLFYLSLASHGLLVAPLLFSGLGAAAILLHRGRRVWAAVCIAPYALIVLVVAVAVIARP